MVMWNRPSSRRASGATIMPPPKQRPLATAKVVTVASGTARQEAQRRPGPHRPRSLAGARLLEEAVDHLVDGAVAADGDDQVAAGAQRAARDPGRMHRPLGEGVVVVAHRRPDRCGD